MGVMAKYKTPADYSREAVIYTTAFSMLFSFLMLNTETHIGMLFPLLIAGILTVATGLAALVAMSLTFFRPVQLRSRRVALTCFAVLTAYPVVCILIFS
jgi:hypothetical protein